MTDHATILHIARKCEHAAVVATGAYAPASFAKCGFVHFATPDQALMVADCHYRGCGDLVLLLVDPARLSHELRYENLDGGLALFPHLYGRLNMDAVIGAFDFPPGPDGLFEFPDGVRELLAARGHRGASAVELAAFNACTIHASDLDRSLAFYTNTLGMTIARRMGDGYLLDAARGQLTVYLEGGWRAQPGGADSPRTCMCFRPAGGVRAAREALVSAGAVLVGDYEDGGPDFHMFRIADPDGMLIEFAGRP